MAMGSPQHSAKIDGFSDLREQTSYPANTVEINIARHSGYCWGVQRAYNLTLKLAEETTEPLATFGPLIHNPQTVDELRKKHNVNDVTKVSEFKQGRLIIRTHGVPLAVQQKFKDQEVTVVDATCPYVRVTQNYAKLLSKEKYHVVILGDPKHPEVISILSYAGGEGTVVHTPNEVENIPRNKRRLGVVIQSTMILAKANEIITRIISCAQEVRIFNTICYVTDERQSDAEEIARSNEFVVVVGGRQSSNTKKLALVAEHHGARTQLIERPEELRFDEFADAKKIGILAGASTPNWLIDDVVKEISDYFNDQ